MNSIAVSNRRNITDWIQNNTDRYSFLLNTSNGTQIAHHPKSRRPLASLWKIGHLAACSLSPKTWQGSVVPLDAWEKFHLVGSDAGAHLVALKAAGLPSPDQLPHALPRPIPFDRLIQSMMTFSDNAAADVILEIVGSSEMAKTIEAAGSSLPVPPRFLAESLALFDYAPASERQKLERLLVLPSRVCDSLGQTLARFYLEDADSRNFIQRSYRELMSVISEADVFRWAASRQRGEIASFLPLIATVMERDKNGTFFRLLATPRQVLGAPCPAEPGVVVRCKFGMLPGVVSGIAIAVSPDGPPTIALLACEDVPADLYRLELQTPSLRTSLIELVLGRESTVTHQLLCTVDQSGLD